MILVAAMLLVAALIEYVAAWHTYLTWLTLDRR